FLATDFTNSIDVAISGIGSLTKQGVGTLTLSGLNTYSGDTLITAGTLSISSSYLSDLAAVKIDSGALFNLGFSGSDSIGSLWLGGLQMAGGTYNSTTYGSYFTGNGSLVVPSVVPEPGTLVLLFTGLAFAGSSWRKRLASSRN
ncbi:MAG: autotransporter-associated beta strand repeat-containing protein, partial [Planctomycetota bacterium]